MVRPFASGAPVFFDHAYYPPNAPPKRRLPSFLCREKAPPVPRRTELRHRALQAQFSPVFDMPIARPSSPFSLNRENT
jgi:hypothetical protein